MVTLLVNDSPNLLEETFINFQPIVTSELLLDSHHWDRLPGDHL